MESELYPAVYGYINEERLAGGAPGATALLRAAAIDIDPREKQEQFEWAWRRRAGLSPAITIWGEGILPAGSDKWLSVERIDVQHRRSGRPWHTLEIPRANRRFSVIREAYENHLPLLAFLQINRWSKQQLTHEDRTAEVAVRVKDRLNWYVAQIRDGNQAVLVRGTEPWTPTPEQIAAAEARWSPSEPAPTREQDNSTAFDAMTAPIVFVNVGWMRLYQGQSEDDPISADNFAYFAREGNASTAAHEQWNFAPTEGKVFGYVPRSTQINISNLGASANQQELRGVLVVFMSRDPAENLLKVVGWYADATIYRGDRFTHDRGHLTVSTGIVAPANGAVVLPVVDRRITIPTAKRERGGVGQSPIWYGSEHAKKVGEVRAFIASYVRRHRVEPPEGRPGRSPRQLDPETRLNVEKAAMNMAMAYFDGAQDVSKHARGWDIEAFDSGGPIFVEVKGLSGDKVIVELTPNEYEKLEANRDRYVLFIVTNALTVARRSRTFRFDASAKAWLSSDLERLSFRPMTAARVSLE